MNEISELTLFVSFPVCSGDSPFPRGTAKGLLFFCLLTPKVSVLVMCHTRELAFQISKEYERFSKYMPNVKVSQGRETWGCERLGSWRH